VVPVLVVVAVAVAPLSRPVVIVCLCRVAVVPLFRPVVIVCLCRVAVVAVILFRPVGAVHLPQGVALALPLLKTIVFPSTLAASLAL
jgi:hypothetical protein